MTASTPLMLFVMVFHFRSFTPLMLLFVAQTVVAGLAAAIAIICRRRFMSRSVGWRWAIVIAGWAIPILEYSSALFL